MIFNSRKASSKMSSLVCLVMFSALFIKAESFSFNYDEFWKTFKEEMGELEKMAERVPDMVVEESKTIEKKLTDNSEDVTDPTKEVSSSSTVKPNTEVEEIDPDYTDGFNPLGGGDMFSEIFGSGFDNMFSILRRNKPWWQGPNVCVDRQEKNETKDDESDLGSGPQQIIMFGASQFTSCKQTPSKYVCTSVVNKPKITKTVTVTYQCCHGFRRLSSNNNLCSKVESKPAMDALKDLGANEFMNAVKSSGLDEKLDSENITMFIPTNDALKKYEEKLQESNNIDFMTRRRRQSENGYSEATATSSNEYQKELVLSHMTPGLLELADITNEKTLISENNSTIRLNVYYGKQVPVVTANCVPIKSGDNYASNAVIHTIDRVLPVVDKNILEFLFLPQFSEFKALLENNDLIDVLSKEGPFTVFAPTNDAIRKLDAGLRAKYERGEACIKTVLKHHILQHSLCTAAVNQTRITTVNLGGDWIHVHAEDDGNIMIDNKARVTTRDMVATNGVLHAVEKILSPKTAKPVSELLSLTNHSSWLSIMERAGVIEELNNAENLTLFVPSESVLSNKETMAKLDLFDNNALRDVVLYHAGRQGCGEISGDEEIDSFLPSKKLHINTYSAVPGFSGLRSRVTVECARVFSKEGKACNSAVYQVDRLLLPPNGTILQMIESDSKLSRLNEILKGTDLEEELKSSADHSFTFLAPTNEAFETLPEESLKELSEDKKFANTILRRHVIQETVCCSGIGPTIWPFTKSVETLSGKLIEIYRDSSDEIRFGGNLVVQCDNIASDGLIHHVSNVFIPKKQSIISTGTILFGNPPMEVKIFA